VDRARHLSRGDTLNAALADQWRLLDLQALDSKLDQLAHRRRSLPEHAAADDLGARAAKVRDLLVAAQTEESDIAREQGKAEADVDQVRARADRDQQRLHSGQVGSPKELESLQHEIQSLARRQSDLEDTVLEIMERLESAQARVAELTTDRERLETELAETGQRRDAQCAEIDGEAETVRAERAALAGALPADLVTLYEKVRDQHDGVGAAALRQRRCEGCRLELSPTDLQRIRLAPDDAVLRCEECRRILVRTSESGL
jgi:predicted  nucleic acid-binding Zn-ribbon protein